MCGEYVDKAISQNVMRFLLMKTTRSWNAWVADEEKKKILFFVSGKERHISRPQVQSMTCPLYTHPVEELQHEDPWPGPTQGP